MIQYPYQVTQRSRSDLKASARLLIESASSQVLTNVETGRTPRIYSGHAGHEGHIPRTILALLENEGVVDQDKKMECWRFRVHAKDSVDQHVESRNEITP